MRTLVRTADPFAMLVDPEGFFQEIEKSERLRAIHGRICRPLDRVVTPKGAAPEGPSAHDGSLEDDVDID